MPKKKPLTILNSKDIKQLMALITNQWGVKERPDLVWLLNSKQKIYLVTKELSRLDTSKLAIDTCGIYFGETRDRKDIRLSIEGSQMIGPKATKNVIELTKEEMRRWLKGQNLVLPGREADGFVIARCGTDFLGCGRYSMGILQNFIPKTRRILAED